MVASEVEIDQLATELIGKSDSDQIVKDALCAATEARRWDEVIKWNRVRWRMRMMQRPGGRPVSPCLSFNAGP